MRFTQGKVLLKPVMYLLCGWLFVASSKANILIAAQNEWPPYIMNDAYGRGLAYDIVSNALAKQGYQIQFSFKPWTRSLKELRMGKIDLIIALWKSPERAQWMHFSESYLTNDIHLVGLKGDDLVYHSPESLRGKTIALIENYAYDPDFLASDAYTHFPSTDLINSIRQVLSGRADMFVEDKLVTKWTLINKQLPYHEFVFIENSIASTPLHVAVRKSHPQAEAIIKAINQGIKETTAEDIQSLKRKYSLD